MPLSAAAASILGAGISSAGSLGTGFMNQGTTRRQQKRAHKMNIELWNMQNAYNTPEAQMQRLKDAGLNPNLIYGESTAGSTGQAGAISPVKATNAQFENPLQNIHRFADTRNKEEQTNNLQTQNDVLEAEVLLKSIEAAMKSKHLGAADQLIKSSIDAAAENVKNIQLRNKNQSVQNIIQDETKMSEINRIKTAAQNAAANLKGQKLLNELRSLEADLKAMGIERSDNMILRFLGRQWPEIRKRYEQYKGTMNRVKN